MGGCCNRQYDCEIFPCIPNREDDPSLPKEQTNPQESQSSPDSKSTVQKNLRKSKTAVPIPSGKIAKEEISQAKSVSGKQTKARKSTSRLGFTAKRLSSPFQDIYNVKGEVACDSFGPISLVEHRRTGVESLVRIVCKAEEGKSAVMDLSTEVKTLEKIDHPNVLKPVTVLEDGTHFYLFYRPLQGGEVVPFPQVLERVREAEVASIAMQIIQAMKFFHSLRIVHKNISAKNAIFIEAKEGGLFVLLTGFGAERKKSKEKDVSAEGLLAYFSPEAFRREFHEESDVWSCGVLIYLLASGQLPFKALSKEDLRYEIENTSPSFPMFIWGGFSSSLIYLVAAMLSADPKQRISLHDCIAHDWMKKRFFPLASEAVTDVLATVRLFRGGKKLKLEALSFLSITAVSTLDVLKAVTAFNAIDTTGEGCLQKPALLSALKDRCPAKEAETVAARVMDALDYNKSGEISCSVFIIATIGEKSLLAPGSLQATFKMMDEDGSGTVSVNELKRAIGGLEDWKALAKTVDEDGSGELDYAEFAQLMSNIVLSEARN